LLALTNLNLTNSIVLNSTLAVTTPQNGGVTNQLSGVISGSSGLRINTAGGIAYLANTNNSFGGGVHVQQGTYQVANVGNAGANSALGTNGTIKLGNSGTSGTLQWLGSAAETTDKVFDLAGTTGGGTINASGTGLFKITQNLSTSGSGAKTLTLNGTGQGEFAGAIGNSGGGNTALIKSGAGTWTLSGANNYGGGTLVSAGTLAGDTTSLQGTITNNATLHFAQSTNGTYAGVISGSGSLTKSGNARLTFSGANSLSGATTVSAGTLELANTTGQALSSTVSVTVGATASLLISQSDQVNNNAAVTLSGGTITRASGVTEVFGNLNVSAASFLDFGSGAAGSLRFGTYARDTGSALLTVQNFFQGNSLVFSQNLVTAGFIDSSSSGSYNNGYFAFGDGFTTSWNGTDTFTITAIPEPTTYAAAVGLLLLCLFSRQKRGRAGQ
jgi:autotransporter-associated beta strand protein